MIKPILPNPVDYLPLVHKISNEYCKIYSEEYEDIYSSGVLGLIKAIDRFDPCRWDSFGSYAYIRVRGEIKDYFRRKKDLGLPLDSEDYERTVDNPCEYLPDEVVEKLDLIEYALATIERLPYKHRHIIKMLHLDGLTMLQIALHMGISESRVCQINKEALKVLNILINKELAVVE